MSVTITAECLKCRAPIKTTLEPHEPIPPMPRIMWTIAIQSPDDRSRQLVVYFCESCARAISPNDVAAVFPAGSRPARSS